MLAIVTRSLGIQDELEGGRIEVPGEVGRDSGVKGHSGAWQMGARKRRGG